MPGGVERVEELRVQEVVGAGDVRVDGLEVLHDLLHVRVGQRGAATRDVLLDRRTAQVELAAVELEQPVADPDAAEADHAAVGLHGRVPGQGGERGGVAVGAPGSPEPRPGHADRERDARHLPRHERPGGLLLLDRLPAPGRLQPQADPRGRHGRRPAVLEHPVDPDGGRARRVACAASPPAAARGRGARGAPGGRGRRAGGSRPSSTSPRAAPCPCGCPPGRSSSFSTPGRRPVAGSVKGT